MSSIEPILRVQRVLWAALAFAPASYAIIARVAAPIAPRPPDPIMLPALAAVALSSAAVSFFLPSSIFRSALRARVGGDIRVRETAAPQIVVTGYRDAPNTQREVENPAAAMLIAARLDQPALILTLALRESVAIFGLVLAFMGHSFTVTAAFCVASVLLILLRFPSETALRMRAERALDARIAPTQ